MDKNHSRQEYIARINKVMDHIERNMESQHSLESLAAVASFSPYHFHRIFTALMGETLNDFLKRIRLERSASLLMNNAHHSVAEVAYKCGFSSPSVFCRAFKGYFGCSAKGYREKHASKDSKDGKFDSKNGKERLEASLYFCDVESKNIWRRSMNAKVEVMEMPAWNLIYCRHTGPFDQIGKAYGKLTSWAGPRGLLNQPGVKTLTVYHDDPSVTEIDKVRQSACLTVTGNVKVEGEIGKMEIPAGRYAVGHFEIKPTEFQEAWDAVCLWLTESGYQPCDGNAYELYHNDFTKHPEGKFIVDICVPVKVL